MRTWRRGRLGSVSGLGVGGGLLVWLVGALVAGWGLCVEGAGREDERRWLKLTTPHFVLYSNAGGAESRTLLRELETFRHVLSRFLGLTNVQHEAATVYLFGNERSFTPYKPLYEGQAKPVNGFQVQDPLGTALAATRQGKADGTMRVMYHEYTHLLTARQFRNVPPWAAEGVAEVFSTLESDGNAFDLGVAVTNHVRYLQRSPPQPIASLLKVDRDSPDYNELERAGKFYATSWLLTHYLVFARRGYETNVMARYAAFCSATTNQLVAFGQAFGAPPSAFDAALKEYLKGGKYTIVRQTYAELATVQPVESPLAPGELDYALGRLLQMTAQAEPAKARLAEACRRAPGDPRPREALAVMAWREREREAGAEYVEEALRLGSKESFIHFIAAEMRYHRVQSQGVDREERARLLREGRALSTKAVALDRWSAAAHHILGIYTLAENPGAAAKAMEHVRQALRCDPEYQPALLTWASLLAMQGNYGAARQVLQRMLAGPLSPELREGAREVMQQVESAARKAGRPGAPRR